jgi:uncharacterized protein
MKTIIKKETLEGLNTLQYISESADKLLFLQHGIFGSKEKIMNLLGVSFVKLGYHVIGIDAHKHGSRLAEPFISKDNDLCELDASNVVRQTAEDILTIYEKHFKSHYKTFDIAGISMGGLTAYYLSTITKDINHLIALISSPKLLEATKHRLPENHQELYPNSEQVLKQVEAMDPSKNVDDMHFRTLIMFSGKEDKIIPYQQSESFYQTYKDTKNIIFKTYKTDHKINKKMHEDLLDLLKKSYGGYDE